MELNLVNEQGQETAKVPASDAVFARQYNEALVHQLVVAYMAVKPRVRASHDQETLPSEGNGSCTCRYVVVPALARRRSYFPEHTERKLF